MNKMQAWNGVFGFAGQQYGIVSPDYSVFQVIADIEPRFYTYLFKTDLYAGVFGQLARGMGTAFLRLNTDDFGSVDVPLPERCDQERIANFLDEQTARIDALIAEKESLLERIAEHQYSYASRLMTRGMNENTELKPTSASELGDVPTHWTVTRLKFLGEVRSGVAKGKDHGERDTVRLPYLRVANVQDGYVDLGEVLDIEVGTHEVERFLLRKGDVLMNEGGDNDKLGRGTVWQGQIDPCVHQNHVFAVRLFDVDLAEWVARYTSTDAARTYFYLRSKQSTNLASINQSNVRELPVPMPPDEERKMILEEIRRSAIACEELRIHVRDHVSRLREYRSSLISAAVTGQIDVCDFRAPAEACA
ncbi:MAG TPA: restriction endonuclease subunit S [Rhodocyclaceae bacterium]|nr:restriction endonuclease subunit S [Rhodocyclaceae bacterium]HNC60200.1 restriction endonuclease subunit S [Rhodocyclaceae bacterium]HNH11480.1 restriction endonuclease subunit S [Rhodocyclaceae bacterium]